MNQGRSGHACGVLTQTDEATGKKDKVNYISCKNVSFASSKIELNLKFIVVAGGSTGSDYAKTVELLKISETGDISDSWTEGPALPQNVLFGTMVHYK